MADLTRSRILLSFLDGPGYPARSAARPGALTRKPSLLLQVAELVRVPHGENPCDPAVLHHQADESRTACFVVDRDAEAAVDPEQSDFRVERGRWEGPQKICPLLRPVHRHPNGLGDAAAVGDEYDVGGQHVHQAL